MNNKIRSGKNVACDVKKRMRKLERKEGFSY